MITAKPTDAPPTAAEALAILEGPERARRAEAEAEEAERERKARQVARQALEQRRAFLVPYRAEIHTWSAQRPPLGEGELEESLGKQRRLYFDQALLVGAQFSDLVGHAEAEAQRLSAALDQPLGGEPLKAAIRGVDELKTREAELQRKRATWRGVRANTAREFARSRATATALERWMRPEEAAP